MASETDPVSQSLADQAQTAQPSAPSAPQPASSTLSAPAAQPASIQPPGGGAPASSPGFVGIREALASGYGLDLRKHYPDDHAALAALANGFRQAQQYQPIVSQYQQHQQEFQQYLAAKQEQARQAQAQQPQSWWKAPEFDPQWRNQIVKDPVTGRLVAAEGADPNVVQKYMAAMQHTQQFLDKFAFDPIGSIRPGIEEVVREIAAELTQQQLGGYQEQVFAQSWVGQNSGWLHARDQAGNLLTDPQTGRPALSELGQRFVHYVRQGESAGMRSVQAQQEYAMGMVQRDYLMANRQQQSQQTANGQPVQTQLTPAQQQQQASNQQFLQQAAARTPSYGAAAAAQQPRPKNDRELQSQMMAAMAAAGYGPGSQLPVGPASAA